MRRVVYWRGEKDEPEVIESPKMGSHDCVCDECANHVIREYSAKRQFVPPSWDCFPLCFRKSRCHLDICFRFNWRVILAGYSCVCMRSFPRLSSAEDFSNFSCTFGSKIFFVSQRFQGLCYVRHQSYIKPWNTHLM